MTLSALLGFAAIAAADDLQKEVVEVPAWGGAVTVRELTVKERLDFASFAVDSASETPAWLVATAALAPDGGPLCADKAAGMAVLAGKGKTVAMLSEVILRLSGFVSASTVDDDQDAAAKN